jgi:cation:H+ antiporter
MIAAWGLLFVAGLIVASLASRRAVTHALLAADSSQTSAGFIGLTVVAIGTDLPEIANSVISAATGHGDLNVGDSAGSALTQVTLVLGILCFSTRVKSERRTVAVLGILTTAALLLIAVLVDDGMFGRWDGLLLVAAWLVAMGGLRMLTTEDSAATNQAGRLRHHVILAGAWLVVVAVAATAVVQSFVQITESIGVPEILAGAVVLALGTSLPELIVDWTAIRRGAAALALGDLFGSSFLDATLAIGIGPAITPTVVSAAAVTTCVIAAIGVLGATLAATMKPTLDRSTAFVLIGIYLAASAGLIVATG